MNVVMNCQIPQKNGEVLEYRHDYQHPSSILHSVVRFKLCRLSDVRGKDDQELGSDVRVKPKETLGSDVRGENNKGL